MDGAEYSYLIVVAICFFFSSYFSLTETALTSLTPLQSDRLAEVGGWFNSSIRHWIKQPSRLLTTILVCNTLANSMAAIYAARYLQSIHPEISDLAISITATIAILVFGEIAPKIVARSFPEIFAPVACRILVGFHYVFYPFTYLVTRMISVVFETFGVIISHRPTIKPSDVEYMINRATAEGAMEQDKTQILSSVFQFSKRRVKDIMVPRDKMIAISIDTNILGVIDLVRNENHSRYPVYNSNLDRIVGFLHVRDLFGLLRAHGLAKSDKLNFENISIRTCLRRAFFISEHSMISRVLNDMKANRIHLAIVKDEWGNVVGMVTLEDILEEIFGEIRDEHDDEAPKPVGDLYSSGIEIEGSESLVDLKSKYEIDIEPSESYSTLNGFLQHYASHQQLTPNTVIIWEKYVFSILSVKDGEIEKVRVTEIPEDKE
jgi:CBS domain containing-hemolysin-like protein